MVKPEPWLYPLKVEYDRRKVCECNPRTFVLDYKNKLVYCSKCGAIIDPFEALLDMAHNAESIQRSMFSFTQAAEKERRSFMRFRGVNNISKKFRDGLWPVCPHCSELIDPMEISRYVRPVQEAGHAQ
ncbi:hypothetical protein [Oscillibacter sp.]|uniref:hypothetical protein n=1 Tax=Oscillibacter sp. TaxID=1945593 RepID=UPI002898181E|nr:hypothetical protein [Oscillibacter sp.]